VPQNGQRPCRDPLGSASNNYGYSTQYPMARYQAGSTICLAWPSKNHVAATCTNQYIPDTELALFASATGSSDPNQSVFSRNLIRNWTEHQNGKETQNIYNTLSTCRNISVFQVLLTLRDFNVALYSVKTWISHCAHNASLFLPTCKLAKSTHSNGTGNSTKALTPTPHVGKL
jgi:hypothetical protein